MKRDTKIILMGAVIVAGIVGVLGLLSPIRQDPTYHRFADQRVWLDIPHVGDVVSNLLIALVGLLGLIALYLVHRSKHPPTHVWMAPYVMFFVGFVLVGAGSAYYHWAPDNASLVWDRLPMTLAFMSIFCAVIADRVGMSIGKAIFVPLLLAGAASVMYWSFSGDLRPYGLVQFLPIVLLLLVCWMFPPHNGIHGRHLGGVLLLYGFAKILEYYDHQIWNALGHTVSGHTLKHVFAAAAGAMVVWFVANLADPKLHAHSK
jgi:hypothetical protein